MDMEKYMPEKTVTRLACVLGVLIVLLTISTHPLIANDELASVEFLPLDKFDTYLPADALPYPWHTLGTLTDDLQVMIQAWAESPVTGNRVSGKGVEIYDNSTTDGIGIGFGKHFIQAPVGPVFLGFDMRVDRRCGDANTMKLAVNLGREQDDRISITASIKDGIGIHTSDVKAFKLSECKGDVWYHVSIVGDTESSEIHISVTPHTNEKKVGWRSINLKPYQAVQLPKALGQPTDIRFESVAPKEATGAWNIDNVCMAGDVTAPRQRWWSFKQDMKDADPTRKVFAYYFPPFSGYGHYEDPALAWSFWQWENLASDLDPRRRDAGCKMQYIALPRVPLLDIRDKKAVKAYEMKEEVKLGMMMGMDGFITDFNHNPQGGWNWFNMMSTYLLDAAAQTNGKFAVIPAIYSHPSKSGVNGEADEGNDPKLYAQNPVTLDALKHPGVYKNEAGKAVLSMWLTERHSPQWWTGVLDELDQQGAPTALFTQFNSMGRVEAFSKIAYGMGHWGPRAPTDYGWYEAARPYTKLLAYPIVAQDARTRGAHLVEAQNTKTIRKLWTDAINKQADWAVINTWTDYTEQAQMPSTVIGYGLYDLNAYYTQWFKTKKQPEIVRDVLYYCYRRQHTDAPQLHGVRWQFGKDMNINSSPEKNEIELLAFLKSPGTLIINIDGQIYRQETKGGITSFIVPLPKDKRFVPYFAVERDGNETLGGLGRYTVFEKVDYPNLLYHYGMIVE
jgi:hypothetical protein